MCSALCHLKTVQRAVCPQNYLRQGGYMFFSTITKNLMTNFDDFWRDV